MAEAVKEAGLCRACGHGDLRAFYEAPRIPVESCLLAGSRHEAIAFPMGDLRLDFCRRCGFIQNSLFDPGLQAQTTQYEDSQAASPTFGRFAGELARGLMERHGLQGKRVLEVGCGRGEFLRLLCDLGGCTGFGLDPLATRERVREVAHERITFIPERFAEAHGSFVPDLICCRHTLEHIPDVSEFIGIMRRATEARRSVVLYFEVPDAGRILRERAFWDVYYEHCSYFTADSLSRLFRNHGFEILDLRLGFGNQYLLLECAPGPTGHTPSRLPPGSAQGPAELVDSFAVAVRKSLGRWTQRFEQYERDGGTTVLWGSGSKAVAFLTTLRLTDEVSYVVDIDTRKQGKFLPGTGHKIVDPRRLVDRPPRRIVVMNPVYLNEIGNQVGSMGLDIDLIPLA